MSAPMPRFHILILNHHHCPLFSMIYIETLPFVFSAYLRIEFLEHGPSSWVHQPFSSHYLFNLHLSLHHVKYLHCPHRVVIIGHSLQESLPHFSCTASSEYACPIVTEHESHIEALMINHYPKCNPALTKLHELQFVIPTSFRTSTLAPLHSYLSVTTIMFPPLSVCVDGLLGKYGV